MAEWVIEHIFEQLLGLIDHAPVYQNISHASVEERPGRFDSWPQNSVVTQKVILNDIKSTYIFVVYKAIDILSYLIITVCSNL